MTQLPTAYIAVASQLTSYWGTYLPSIVLAPGDIGRRVAGVFVKEGRLDRFQGYDPARHGTERQAYGGPGTAWKSEDVEVLTLGGDAKLTGSPLSGSLQLKFGNANDAVILCRNVRTCSFSDLLSVKALLQELRVSGAWNDPELCLITEVLTVDWGWIGFATARDQVAEITLSARVPLTGLAVPVLDAAAASGSIAASWQSGRSAGWHAEVQPGGTPLFRAIRFRKGGVFGLGAQRLDYDKGPSELFEEPDFGDALIS